MSHLYLQSRSVSTVKLLVELRSDKVLLIVLLEGDKFECLEGLFDFVRLKMNDDILTER